MSAEYGPQYYNWYGVKITLLFAPDKYDQYTCVYIITMTPMIIKYMQSFAVTMFY